MGGIDASIMAPQIDKTTIARMVPKALSYCFRSLESCQRYCYQQSIMSCPKHNTIFLGIGIFFPDCHLF